jgi:hypothetical protein
MNLSSFMCKSWLHEHLKFLLMCLHMVYSLFLKDWDDFKIFLLYLAVLANEFFPKFTSKIITVTPLIGVILTTLLCASPVS